MATHKILGGLVQVYKRSGRYWQCATSVGGRQHRETTKEEGLEQAKQFAEDWYLGLRGKKQLGLLKKEKSFNEAADKFLEEYEVITEGQRSKKWTQGHEIRLRLHLRPFFGDEGLSQITPGMVQDYRVHRIKSKAVARSTLHDEVGTLRLVLKAAIRHRWLDHLPDLSAPYGVSGKVRHRPWFSPAEYKQLYEATRKNAREPLNPFYRWEAEQLHDWVLFLGNTGLRPDEAKHLQFRDVSIVLDRDTGKHILEIEVRSGKRGVGWCKSMPGAVKPFERLRDRPRPVRGRGGDDDEKQTPQLPKPTDILFPGHHLRMFNNLLEREGLKVDRNNQARTAYSLRHTYICLRLIEKADVYAIAKNCRTSVEMIERHYAAHIKDTLDASSINTRRPRSSARKRHRGARSESRFET